MQHTFLASAAALALALTCGPVHAQIQIVPASGEALQLPANRQTKTGTARVKGRVLSAESGGPVRRAQVRIMGTDIMPKTATTDNDGNYEFRDLPAGRFTINASKSGYVNVGYGQSRPNEAAKPIELREGQLLERLDITMPRGSVISGRIVDEFGEPVAEAVVTAMRSTWFNGRRRLQPGGRTAMTNDLGQYRIYGLPPGDYYVTATLRGSQEMMVMEMAVVATMSSGPAPDAPRSGYAPTYYPGTPNGSEAQKVTLNVGQEAQNTDFGLLPVRLARVSGSVVGSDGRPLSGVMINALPRNRNDSSFVMTTASARTDQNGHFTINSLPPGDYTLNARSTQVMSSSDGNRVTFTMTRVEGGGGDGQSEFGSAPLTVAGDDVSNVMIVTTKGSTVSGRVVWEGASKPTGNTLRITAASGDADNPIGMPGGSSTVTAEGKFEIKGLVGQRIFRVVNVPAGWILKAVRLNGADITDTGVEIKPGEPIGGLEVVLTSKMTEVTGAVTAGTDPATDYTVVIFAEDSDKWTVPMTRHVSSARPNQEGRFQVRNLPAGSYYAVAVAYIPQGDWNDPDVLERLRAKATRFSIDEGETKVLDLRLEEQY